MSRICSAFRSGSPYSFHQSPRDKPSAGCAGIQGPASLYAAAVGTAGILSGGARAQPLSIAAAARTTPAAALFTFIGSPQGNPRLQSREELRYSLGRRAYPYRRKAAQPNIGGLLAQAGASERTAGR